MDTGTAEKFLKIRNLAEHVQTPPHERRAAERSMAKMRSDHPNIDKAADLIRRIIDGELDDPQPAPPPPPPPFGSVPTGAGGWAAFAARAAENPAVQAAVAEAFQTLQGRVGDALAGALGGEIAGLEPIPKGEAFSVDTLEAVGGKGVLSVLVRVREKRLNGKSGVGVLDEILDAVGSALGFENDEDDEDEDD
jgi:hypothetical protein